MAKTMDTLMRVYNFVDNTEREHRQDARRQELQKRSDARLSTVQQRQDILWNQQQEQRSKKLGEHQAFVDNLSKYVISQLPPDAQNDPQAVAKAKAVVVDTALNPGKIANNISNWDNNIVPAFERGSMPDEKQAISAINTTLHPELRNRFAKNGLQGKISGLRPTPDGSGLYMEATVKDSSGAKRVVPLTDNATSAASPNSGQHQVQAFPVGQVIKQVGDGVATQKAILQSMMKYGGQEGVNFVLGRINQEFKAKAGMSAAKAKSLQAKKMQALKNLGLENVAKEKGMWGVKIQKVKNSTKGISGGGSGMVGGVKPATVSNKISAQKAIDAILKSKDGGKDKLSPYELEQINSYRKIVGDAPLKQVVSEKHIYGDDYGLVPDTGGDLVSKLRAALEAGGAPPNPDPSSTLSDALPEGQGVPDNRWGGSAEQIQQAGQVQPVQVQPQQGGIVNAQQAQQATPQTKAVVNNALTMLNDPNSPIAKTYGVQDIINAIRRSPGALNDLMVKIGSMPTPPSPADVATYLAKIYGSMGASQYESGKNSLAADPLSVAR